MKRVILSTITAMSLASVAPYTAAMPVFDPAVFAQAVLQVQAWKTQLEQMTNQLKQLEETKAAVTGSRGLGDILNNPEIRQVVPAEPAQSFDAVRTAGAAGLSTQAATIRQASKIYDCENRTGVDLSTCMAFLNNGAQTAALHQNAMVRLNQRVDQINSLQGRINSTNDPKAISELTARLIAESAQIANDANRLMVLRAIAESADRANQQALKERELVAMARHGDGSDTFVYKPYVIK